MVSSGWSTCTLTDATSSCYAWDSATSDSSSCTLTLTSPTAYKRLVTTCPISNLWVTNDGPTKINAGAGTIELPDGAKLIVDDLGNYKIEDKDAKVTYQANKIREFSPHLNASDMLAQFVKYVGGLGVKQEELLGLPIELFINWLVIEAAERDGDEVPSDIIRPIDHEAVRLAVRPQCRVCGRFIHKRPVPVRFPFCGVEHAQRYIELASKPVGLLGG